MEEEEENNQQEQSEQESEKDCGKKEHIQTPTLKDISHITVKQDFKHITYIEQVTWIIVFSEWYFCFSGASSVSRSEEQEEVKEESGSSERKPEDVRLHININVSFKYPESIDSACFIYNKLFDFNRFPLKVQ